MNPQLAVPGWRPVLIDYLYLGFTNATAFSPTDVMPLAHWAKMAMAFTSPKRFNRATTAYPGNLVVALRALLEDPPAIGVSGSWWL